MASLPSNPDSYSARAWPGDWPGMDASPSVASWFVRRPVRVMLLLSAVWMLNAFDLLFTILAARLGSFVELNPVAAHLLGDGTYTALGMFKTALVVIGTCLLWQCRRYRLCEVGCWMVFFVYTGLAWRWLRYYQVWNYYCAGECGAGE